MTLVKRFGSFQELTTAVRVSGDHANRSVVMKISKIGPRFTEK
jgi:hypothetical protein